MENVSYTLFNLKLLEPGTFISDIALGIACLIYYSSLKSIDESKVYKYYPMFFLFMALSSFIGAFAHLLFLYTGKALQLVGWLMTILAVYLIEMGVSSNMLENRNKALYKKIIVAKFFIFTFLTIIYLNFLLVKIDIAIGLLLVVSPLLIVQFYSTGSKSNLYIVIGILLALIPAILHSFRFRFNGLINMNDFSHYFLIICMFFMYIGLRGLMLAKAESRV